MTRVESSIVVSKSVEETFAFLTKRESHRSFIPRMVSLTQTTSGNFSQVGGIANGSLNYFGIKIPVKYEIIENVTNEKLAMSGSMPYVNFKDGYVLSKQVNGTKITFWLELSPFGYAIILSPFARLIGKVHAWETLRNLKRGIENMSLRGGR